MPQKKDTKLKMRMTKSISSLLILCFLSTFLQSCGNVQKAMPSEQNTKNSKNTTNSKVNKSDEESVDNEYYLYDTIQIKTLYKTYNRAYAPYRFSDYGFYVTLKSDTNSKNLILTFAHDGVPGMLIFYDAQGKEKSEFLFEKQSGTMRDMKLSNVDSFKNIYTTYYPSGRLKTRSLNSPLTEGIQFKLEENGDTIFVVHNCLNYFKDSIPQKQYRTQNEVRSVSVHDGERRVFQNGKLQQIQRWQDGKLIDTQYQDTSLQVEPQPKSSPLAKDAWQLINLSTSARLRYRIIPPDSISTSPPHSKPISYELIQEELNGSNWQIKMAYTASNGIIKEIIYFDEQRNQYHIYYDTLTGTVDRFEFTNSLNTKQAKMYFYTNGKLKRKKI
ncbi:MAG: hypothetical protein NWQ47_10455 [Crocinitomicaceae bacterium]|jgi:hypothetical protein|nr:hypothetical protein [Crocinitomicaceae bacterium]